MMVLGPGHSGLTIQNYQGERAVVSGAVPLGQAGQGNQPRWTKVPAAPSPARATATAAAAAAANWTLWPEVNNVFGRAPNPNGGNPADGVKFLGKFDTLPGCAGAAAAAVRGKRRSIKV